MKSKSRIGCFAISFIILCFALPVYGMEVEFNVSNDLVTIVATENQVQQRIERYYVEGPDNWLVAIGDTENRNECSFKMPARAVSGMYKATMKVEGQQELIVDTFYYESHDSVTEIALNTTVTGTLQSGVSNYYTFTVQTPGRYFVQTDSNIDVALYNSQHSELTKQEDGSYPLGPGTYFLEVTGTAGEYSLMVTTGGAQGETFEVVCQEGEEFVTAVTVRNLSTFAGKTIQVIYSAENLAMIDFAAQTYGADTALGPVPNTDLTILSNENGVLTFQISREIPNGKSLFGTVNLIKWKALTDYNGALSIEIL